MKTQLDYEELDRTRPERLARIAEALDKAARCEIKLPKQFMEKARDNHDEGRE